MNTEQFNRIFNAQVDLCGDTLIDKAREYATEDRLHNFKVAAAMQKTTSRDALCGMMAKHIVSIFDLAREENLAPMDVWNEKIGDALNYLFLLKAVVVEEHDSLSMLTTTKDNAKISDFIGVAIKPSSVTKPYYQKEKNA